MLKESEIKNAILELLLNNKTANGIQTGFGNIALLVENDLQKAEDLCLDIAKDGCIVYNGFGEASAMKIKREGRLFLEKGGYIEQENKTEVERKSLADKTALEAKKLKFDTKTAERVYNTYPYTQFIAWFTFVIALFLGFLKLAEALKWWPYR